jgi:hypothetical protein
MRVDGGIVLQGKARSYEAQIRFGFLLSISPNRFLWIISVVSCLHHLISLEENRFVYI